MSWLAIDWAETAPVADVYERAIITLLAHRADSDGTGAYPPEAAMARYAMCDEKTIKRRLDALRARGVIAYGDQDLAKHLDQRYQPKVYDLMIPYEWYRQNGHLTTINRERIERGLGLLTPYSRPGLHAATRKNRSDKGIARGTDEFIQAAFIAAGSDPPQYTDAQWSGARDTLAEADCPPAGMPVVYFLYDVADRIAYIGSSASFYQRTSGHRGKPWVRYVARECRSRAEAYVLELLAIEEHQPYLNKRDGRLTAIAPLRVIAGGAA